MAETWRAFLSAWEGAAADVEEYRELDSERVLVFLHYTSGRGKTSGLALEQIRTQGASLFQIRGGKVTRFVAYSDRDCALTSLGLAPQDGAASPAG
jgi:hypothetical protein